MGYYKQKQEEHEEMAVYLFWLVMIAVSLAVVWMIVEIVKFFGKI